MICCGSERDSVFCPDCGRALSDLASVSLLAFLRKRAKTCARAVRIEAMHYPSPVHPTRNESRLSETEAWIVLVTKAVTAGLTITDPPKHEPETL